LSQPDAELLSRLRLMGCSASQPAVAAPTEIEKVVDPPAQNVVTAEPTAESTLDDNEKGCEIEVLRPIFRVPQPISEWLDEVEDGFGQRYRSAFQEVGVMKSDQLRDVFYQIAALEDALKRGGVEVSHLHKMRKAVKKHIVEENEILFSKVVVSIVGDASGAEHTVVTKPWETLPVTLGRELHLHLGEQRIVRISLDLVDVGLNLTWSDAALDHNTKLRIDVRDWKGYAAEHEAWIRALKASTVLDCQRQANTNRLASSP